MIHRDAGLLLQHSHRLGVRQVLLTADCQVVIGVRQGYNPREFGDIVADQMVRFARAAYMLVVVPDGCQAVIRQQERARHALARFGVVLVSGHFADVVKTGGMAQ